MSGEAGATNGETEAWSGARLRSLLPAAVFCFFVLAHVLATRSFLRDFPYSWSWTEVLVDYQGGFVKRGLLGEVAYDLRNLVSPEILIAATVCAVYVLASAVLILSLRLCRGYPGLLFLLCPVGWLFPLLNPAAYGRKDAFVVAALALALTIVDRLDRPNVALLATMAIFALAGLIVEISWFYYPLVLTVLLVKWQRAPLRWRLGASAAAAAYTLGCLLLTLAIPPVDTAAIAESWHHIPFETDDTGALCCLNIGFRNAFSFAIDVLPNLGGYALGLAAGLLPLVLLLARRPPRRVDALVLVVGSTAALAATFPLFVTADWGRYIYLWLTATFLSAWTASGGASAPPDPVPRLDSLIVRGALLAVYGSTWQLPHVTATDRSAFVPGAIFRALGEGTPLSP